MEHVPKKVLHQPAKKRVRGLGSTNGVASGGGGGGRDARPAVEDPLPSSATSRAAHTPRLDLLVRVRTTYRAVTGSRRQTVHVERQTEQLDAATIQDAGASFARRTAPRSDNGGGGGSGGGGGNKPSRQAKQAKNKNLIHAAGVARSASVPIVERVQWMVVPEFLTEELWERHGYSLTDVRKTLDAFPHRVVWQLARSYNCPATNAASRVYCETDAQLTYGGRSTAVQKLIMLLKERHPDWEGRFSITWNMNKLDDPNGDGTFYEAADRHAPNLPVHRITPTAFEALAANIVGNQQHPVMDPGSNLPPNALESARTARGIFFWRGIMIVPLELNRSVDMLLVCRVIPWAKYVQGYGMPTSLRCCPNTVVAADGHYALMNECFYFYCPDSRVARALTQEDKCEATAGKSIDKRSRTR